MLPRTQRRIKQLLGEARAAKRTIEDTVESAHRVVGPNQRSWGQFLDAAPGVPQTGIYGTSAAIEMLANSNHSTSLSEAMDRFPGTTTSSATANKFDTSDLDLTFKCVSIVEALEPGQQTLTRIESVEQLLRSVVTNRPGWGYHACVGAPDPTARILPTALVLGALSRSSDFRSTPEYRNSVEWLAGEVATNSSISPLEKAFALIAFCRNSQWAMGFNGVADAIRQLGTDLNKWANARDTTLIGTYQQVHYWVPSPAPGRNHYMFYPTDLIVSWALLASDQFASAAGHTTAVVRFIVKSVKSSGALLSASTGQKSITDALWSHKVLQWFIERAQSSPSSFVSRAINILEGSTVRRCVTSAILLIATLAMAFGVAKTADTNLPLFAIFTVFSAIAGGILATAWWEWIRGRGL